MIEIKTVELGLPKKEGVYLLVRTLGFNLNPTNIGLYYEVLSLENEVLANGNLNLNEEEIALWGTDDSVVEEIVLTALGLERKQL